MKMEPTLFSFPNEQLTLIEDLRLTGYKTGKQYFQSNQKDMHARSRGTWL
jgi:hypothetical protein